MLLYLYLLCLLLLLLYFTTKRQNYWEKKGVPCDKPFLFFGSFFNVAAGKEPIFHVIRTIYNKFATPYVGIYVFMQPYLVVRDPELIKKVLVKDFDKFVNRPFGVNEKIDPISANTLFGAQDHNWKNTRVKMSPVFTSGKIKLMFPLMKEVAQDLISYLDKCDGKNVEMRATTKKYSVDIISSCAFGINSFCLKNDDSEIMEIATRLLDFKSLKRNFSVLSFFFAPQLVTIFKLTFADKTASDYLINVFKTTMKERQEKKILRNDLIDLLMNLENKEIGNNWKFDDVKMGAQAISFFSAGNDTTSTMITFTLYELALHKDIQDRLRKEIRENYEKNGDFTYDGVQEMKYLDMVFNETLRKYPLTSFLNRKTTTSYKFEETGLTLEKDTAIMIPVSGLHFDPEYFPDPEKFDPERFSDENKHNIKPYTYMPFGEGPRNCIGQRFALVVSKIGLAYIIKHFVVEPSHKTEIPLIFNPRGFLLQNKTGIYLKRLCNHHDAAILSSRITQFSANYDLRRLKCNGIHQFKLCYST